MPTFKSTYRFIALIMACLMFVTSAGFAIDMHFCQGKLKSVSFFGKAKSCHDMVDKSMENCPHHQKMMTGKEACLEDKDCCSNKTVYFQSDQDQELQKSDFVISTSLQQFVLAYVAVFLSSDYTIAHEAIPFAHYKPPLIQKDIPIFHQSFLL